MGLMGHSTPFICPTHSLMDHFLLCRPATPSVSSRPYGVNKGHQSRGQRSPTRQGAKHAGEYTHVTLEDVKGVCLQLCEFNKND